MAHHEIANINSHFGLEERDETYKSVTLKVRTQIRIHLKLSLKLFSSRSILRRCVWKWALVK